MILEPVPLQTVNFAHSDSRTCPSADGTTWRPAPHPEPVPLPRDPPPYPGAFDCFHVHLAEKTSFISWLQQSLGRLSMAVGSLAPLAGTERQQ